ncbi:MAG: FAD-binding oxidoreductase [Planctomycetota bacterium]
MTIFIWTTFVFVGLLVGLGAIIQIAARFLVNSGPFDVSVNDGASELKVEGGTTLLTALYEGKIFIPSACGGQATCGHCKVRILDSDPSKILPTEKSFLTRTEMKNGTRLACQVKVKDALRLKIPDHLLSVKEFNTRVSSTVSLTHDIKELRFELPEGETMEYSYGHYIQVNVPDPDEGTVSRAYSISSPIMERKTVELNVRLHPARGKIPAGKGSTYLHNLKEGDEVTVTGPFGEFELDKSPETQLICVGGGAGMAPMKNLILSILENIPGKPVWLFFGCRGMDDIFYLDMFKELADKYPHFQVIYSLSDIKETEKWDGDTGFIHLSVDRALPDDLRADQAFLCGPPPMIDAVTEVLLDKNMQSTRVFYDKF